MDPLVITLALDASSEACFQQMRQQYYPAHLNRVPAHVSLFHRLPGEAYEHVLCTARAAAAATPPLPLHVADLILLGRGVAFRIRSEALTGLHATLAGQWRTWLSAQDCAGFRAHITIQNKVSVEQARRLFAALKAQFQPFPAIGIGIQVWWYRDGPWQFAAFLPFAPQP